jgi:hypothetical protein
MRELLPYPLDCLGAARVPDRARPPSGSRRRCACRAPQVGRPHDRRRCPGGRGDLVRLCSTANRSELGHGPLHYHPLMTARTRISCREEITDRSSIKSRELGCFDDINPPFTRFALGNERLRTAEPCGNHRLSKACAQARLPQTLQEKTVVSGVSRSDGSPRSRRHGGRPHQTSIFGGIPTWDTLIVCRPPVREGLRSRRAGHGRESKGPRRSEMFVRD